MTGKTSFSVSVSLCLYTYSFEGKEEKKDKPGRGTQSPTLGLLDYSFPLFIQRFENLLGKVLFVSSEGDKERLRFTVLSHLLLDINWFIRHIRNVIGELVPERIRILKAVIGTFGPCRVSTWQTVGCVSLVFTKVPVRRRDKPFDTLRSSNGFLITTLTGIRRMIRFLSSLYDVITTLCQGWELFWGPCGSLTLCVRLC